jgi:opacity protein-like surface antigen
MKYTTLLTLLLLTTALLAQDRRGSWLVAGNTGAAYQDLRQEAPDFRGFPVGGILTVEQSFLTANSFRTGYFLSNRFLLGGQVAYRDVNLETSPSFDEVGRFSLEPFLRYYVLQPEGPRKPMVFAEVGFGTVGIGAGDGWETDFHLGLGADMALFPEVLISANLNYEAMAMGLNYTSLNLGFHALTGQLGDAPFLSPTRAGSFTTNGQWLAARYGRMVRDDVQTDLAVSLTPRVGYFVLPGLMIEGGVDLLHFQQSEDPLAIVSMTRDNSATSLAAVIGARYYPLRNSRLSPFLVGEKRFGRSDRSTTLVRTGRTDTIEDNSTGWRAGAGISYFLSSHLAIDVEATYGELDGEQTFRDIQSRLTTVATSDRVIRGSVGLRFFLPSR